MTAPRTNRRTLLQLVGASTAGLWLAACTTPQASPTTAPPPPKVTPSGAATPAPSQAKPAATSPAKPAATTPSKPAASPAASAATKAPANPADVLSVRFATINGLFHLNTYELAKRKGIFSDAGVELTITPTTGDVVILQGIRAGQFDLSDGGPVTPIVADAQGGDFKMIGTTATKLYYAMYATPKLTSVAELAGKNFGTAAIGSLPHLATEAWLRSQKVDPKSVNFVALGPTPEIFKAVAAGKVDAGVAGMDFLPEAKRQGLTVLTDKVAQDLPGYIMLGIYSTGSDLQDAKKREAFTRYLTALAQMNRMIYDTKNKDEWIKVAVELQARNAEDMSFFYDYMVQSKLLAANVEFNQQQIDFVQQQTVLSGSQPEVLPFDKVATLDLQKEVVRRIGEFKYPA